MHHRQTGWQNSQPVYLSYHYFSANSNSVPPRQSLPTALSMVYVFPRSSAVMITPRVNTSEFKSHTIRTISFSGSIMISKDFTAFQTCVPLNILRRAS